MKTLVPIGDQPRFRHRAMHGQQPFKIAFRHAGQLHFEFSKLPLRRGPPPAPVQAMTPGSPTESVRSVWMTAFLGAQEGRQRFFYVRATASKSAHSMAAAAGMVDEAGLTRQIVETSVL